MPPELIRAFAILKNAAALVNHDLGNLPEDKVDLIVRSVEELRASCRPSFRCGSGRPVRARRRI
jgi:fumarate hydratase class II